MLHRYGPGVLALGVALLLSSTFRLAVVSGGSMEPSLRPGDVCVVKRAESYEAGDVVLCSGRGRRVLHRVVTAGPRALRTKGDANESVDRDPVPMTNVEGHVILVLRTSRLLGLASSTVGAKLLTQS